MTWLAQVAQQEPVSLSWPAIAGGLAAITAVLAGIITVAAWAYRRLRAWVQRTAAAAETTALALRTSNGHSVGDYVESTAAEVRQVKTDVGTLTEWAGEAVTRAERAEQLAQALAQRLDAHLIGHQP